MVLKQYSCVEREAAFYFLFRNTFSFGCAISEFEQALRLFF